MTIQALRDASNDPALRGSPLTVYVWLITNHLDTQEMRRVKTTALAFALKMDLKTITKALRVLCLRGYLERRNADGHVVLYRAFSVRRSPLLGGIPHTHTAA